MIDLNTNLTLKTIKKSEKLQKIKCESVYLSDEQYETSFTLFNSFLEFVQEAIDKEIENYPAPTLADVISNAEKLFRHPMITNQEILIKCYQNKPLADIEKYVLSNLK